MAATMMKLAVFASVSISLSSNVVSAGAAFTVHNNNGNTPLNGMSSATATARTTATSERNTKQACFIGPQLKMGKTTSMTFRRHNTKMRQATNGDDNGKQDQQQEDQVPTTATAATTTSATTSTNTAQAQAQMEDSLKSERVNGDSNSNSNSDIDIKPNGEIIQANGDTSVSVSVATNGDTEVHTNGDSDAEIKANGVMGVKANGDTDIKVNGDIDMDMDMDMEVNANGDTGVKPNGEITNGETDIQLNGDVTMDSTNGEKDMINGEAQGETDTDTDTDVIMKTNGAEVTLTEADLDALSAPSLYDDQLSETRSPFNKYVEGITDPIFGPEIEKGVSRDTLKGALVSGAALTVLFNNFDPSLAGIAALWTAYIAITPGKPGNLARVFGDAAWDTTQTVIRTARNVAAALGFKVPFRARPDLIDGQPLLNGAEEVELDDDIKNLVQEVEDTVAEVETVLSNSNAARDAIAEEERLVKEADQLADEARRLEIEYLLEEAKIEKEAYQAEEEFRAVEAQIAEEERLEKEAELALLAEEERMMYEEARLAEEEEAAEEQKLAEEARLAEEQKLEEEARLAKDAQSNVKADGDDYIDGDEWEASIQLAGENTKDDDEGYTREWKAARQLANDLTDDSDDDLDYDAPGLSEEARMDLIAEAARIAVEKFESVKQEEESIVAQAKEKRNSMKLELQKADILEIPNDTKDTKDVTTGKNEIEPSEDYEKLTVKKLKEILRSRGLKVSGRKAELIERLRSQ